MSELVVLSLVLIEQTNYLEPVSWAPLALAANEVDLVQMAKDSRLRQWSDVGHHLNSSDLVANHLGSHHYQLAPFFTQFVYVQRLSHSHDYPALNYLCCFRIKKLRISDLEVLLSLILRVEDH